MNTNTNTPIQYRYGILTKILKRFLLTQIGKRIGFNFGLRGFNRVQLKHIRNGKVLNSGFVFNARVDKGSALQASLMSGSSLGSISTPLPPIYIALSTNSLTPAKGDTTLSGETVVAGIARALGTVQNYVAPASLDGAGSYDVFKQFTLTGAGTTVISTALFDASSSGNMFAEVNFASSATMATNDVLQVTWTVNI